MPQTYEVSLDGRSIKCLVCGKTSWSAGDIKHRYCEYCHKYHADLVREAQTRAQSL